MRRETQAWTGVLAATGLAAIAIAAIAATLRGSGAGAGVLRDVTYANTALAGSTMLYVAYVWLRTEGVGRAATALAAGGAIGVVIALGIEAGRSGRAVMGLWEGMALLSAVAVLSYLAMERTYRNRSGGGVVMAAVMVAVLCEMWLIVKGPAANGIPGGLGGYWEAGHRFALCLGYCPLAAAAFLGASVPLRPRPGVDLRGVMHAMLSVGAPLCALAAGMGAVWLIVDGAAMPQASTRVALTWVVAGFVLAARSVMRSPEDPRLSRYALSAFAVTSLGLLAWGGVGAAIA